VQVRAARLNGTCEIRVVDTGTGIPSEHLPRLFERFYRVDPARSRDDGGTGIGLAIARSVVEAHGGHIRAESQMGKGSTFTFDLPVAPAADHRRSA
jgi:signal transduction histidine kinase